MKILNINALAGNIDGKRTIRPFKSTSGGFISKDDYRGAPVFIDPQFLGELIYAQNHPKFEIVPDKRNITGLQDAIDSVLLRNNFILIHGPITMQLADEVRMKTQLLAGAMEKNKKAKPLHFLINSPGGLIVAMNSILDAMDRLKNTKINGENIIVSTICDGFAASAASVILANGTKGSRYISPRSEVMIHQPLGGMGGQATDMDIANKRIQKMKGEIRSFFAKTTNMPEEELGRIMERDFWMDAEDSKKLGFVDCIYSDFPTKDLTYLF